MANATTIPIDVIIFSVANEIGYKTWENKIIPLSVRKIKSTKNKLNIIILGKHAQRLRTLHRISYANRFSYGHTQSLDTLLEF